MGGNAFDKLIRLNKKDYNEYTHIVKSIIGNHFCNISETKSFRNKNSFGDLDLVISKNDLFNKDYIRNMISREFGDCEIKFNSDIISFKYMDFQTDMIFVDEKSFDSAIHYYSYNDLNNFIGRIASKLGVKFGWDGLHHQFNDESGHNRINTLLTNNPCDIYEFLDYDYSVYQKGFNELEDIFRFVSSSKYFSKSIFDYENLNNKNRTRNTKRVNYSLFLNWVSENDFGCGFEFDRNKTNYLIKIDSFFPDIDIFSIMKYHSRKTSLKKLSEIKFCGRKVKLWARIDKCKDIGLLKNRFHYFITTQVAINATSFDDRINLLKEIEIENLFKQMIKGTIYELKN